MTTVSVVPTDLHAQQDVAGRERVRITGLTKTFHRKREEVPVLKGIDVTIEEGELLVLLGPSGCGKTTLLRCLVGLEKPTEGSINLDGSAVVDAATGVFVPPNRRDVGMVFQNYALWPHMSVKQNVAYPLKARKLTSALKSGRVEDCLKVVQCDHLADRYPPELSGGQQQRVSLARALAPQPALLLLDEPLSNLDALLRIDLRAQLRHLHRELRFTGVYVTHDQEEAMALGTRVAVMREGRFEQIGDPMDVYARPATEYVAEFLGVRNRLPLAVDAGVAHFENQRLDRSFHPGLADGAHAVRIRPEKLQIRPAAASEDGNWLTGAVVHETLPAGDHIDYVVLLGEHTLFGRQQASDRQRLVPGDQVDVGWKHGDAHFYDMDGHRVDD
jgi:iron(III) transport system ATP-binding protein